mgnify:CR=1 FL=1
MTDERAKVTTALMLVEGMTDEALRDFLSYFKDTLYDDPKKLTEELSFLKNKYTEVKLPTSFEMDVMLVKAEAIIAKARTKGIEISDALPEDEAFYAFVYGDCACQKTVPVRTLDDFKKYKDLI